MKNILTILFCSFILAPAFSQTQIYSYDPTGNRVQRQFLIPSSALIIQNNDTIFEVSFVQNQEIALVDSSQTPSENQTNENGASLQNGEVHATVFPNPTVNVITIIADESLQQGRIVLLDNSGKVIQQQSYNQSNTLQLANLPNGNYIVKLVLGETQFVWTIIKM